MKTVNKTLKFDVLVIGSGLAGFTAALNLAGKRSVALACKSTLEDGASWLAQGGIVAMLGGLDSIETHVQDTLVAGCFVNDTAAVTRFSEQSAAAAAWLIEHEVPFTREGDEIHLTREGGHSQRRILHVKDHTGHSIQSTLKAHIEAGEITVLAHSVLIELIVVDRVCRGAVLMDNRDQTPVTVWCNQIIIGTGGIGQIYERTMSPESVTGDGIAACWRAGCALGNMEFIQFHPTGLYMPGFPTFLISEAVRGEGGLLFNAAGERFMERYDARLELAPRDVVSRAIHSEMLRHHSPCCYLQVSHLAPDFVKAHFPLIYSTCLERGLDITQARIPVSPVTHYTCGGVVVDADAQTEVAGLYCVGESAYTGLHGANRLASNSLLECVVTGQAAAAHILMQAPVPVQAEDGQYQWERVPGDLEGYARVVRLRLQVLMWQCVGLVRSKCNVYAAAKEIRQMLDLLYPQRRCRYLNRAHQETFNMLTVALAVCESALSRESSIGCHYMADFPQAPAQPEASHLPALAELDARWVA